MLSLYRAWLGTAPPAYCPAFAYVSWSRAPPPGIVRPIPRAPLPRATTPPPRVPSPEELPQRCSSVDSDLFLDVEASRSPPPVLNHTQPDTVGTSTAINGAVLDVACCDGPVRFTRILNDSYEVPTSQSATILTTETNSDGTTCARCRDRSFKSPHCSRKHSGRHVRAPGGVDLPYYPCRTCGGKFPSYYFVHKHRRQCHADEEAAVTPRRRTSATATSTTTNTTETPPAVSSA